MPNKKAKQSQSWNEYKKDELLRLTPILDKLGYTLLETQPHTIGERYLMEAVTTTSGKKLILLGSRKKDGEHVVIKATRERNGARELSHERDSRVVLRKINFASEAFLSPEEILFTSKNGYTISVHKFIDQESAFLDRLLEEQFNLALKAFKAQEGAHATTHGHEKTIKKTFGILNADDYIANFKKFRSAILKELPKETIHEGLEKAEKFLIANRETIDQYGGFLVHTDFVPHNVRVSEGNLYLLDHSSIRFGNKYEGWARFLNFMALYNPELEKILVEYVHNNRTEEEHLSLKLMRVYRLGEIIRYYANTLHKSHGDLHTLNLERVRFWSQMLDAILNDTTLPLESIESYRQTRDTLRSDEEKQRQVGLH